MAEYVLAIDQGTTSSRAIIFNHAGTIVEGKEDSATEKIARLEEAGIPVVQRIDEIPDLVKAKIAERSAA